MRFENDFWVASGHHLLDRSEGGGCIVTDSFLRAYLARPELIPPPEACPVERGLHAQLLAAPRLEVRHGELDLVADADGRENLAVFLRFRDLLLRYPTLERAYVQIVSGKAGQIPPLFVQQLTHVIARVALDTCDDPLVLRAAECFFRPQRVSFHEGNVLLADRDVIESHEHDQHHSPLLAMMAGKPIAEIPILNAANASEYRARSDAHDFAFSVTAQVGGRQAIGSAAAFWIRHLTGLDIEFRVRNRLADESFVWFLAFDAEAARLGNAVWRGDRLSAQDNDRILALYEFDLPQTAPIRADLRGKRGFAILAATPDNHLAMKAQNLVVGLPLEEMQG